MKPHVLAIHAAGTTPEIWNDVRAELPELPFITPDVTRLAREANARLDELVRLVCRELPEGELLVTGCAFGGSLALEFAAALGARVRGLVMVAPNPIVTDAHVREGIRHLQDSSLQWTPEQLLAIVPLLLYPDNPRYERAARILGRMLLRTTGAANDALMRIAMELPPADLALGKLDCDLAVVFGVHTVNPYFGADWIPGWRRLVGDERVHLAENAAEMVVMERPELIAHLLREVSRRPAA